MLVIVAVLVFLLLRLTPGDPAAILAGDAASAEQIAQIRTNLGLEKPIVVQFGIWAYRHLDDRRYDRVVVSLLLAMGLSLIVTSW